jgi:hypothetical protein
MAPRVFAIHRSLPILETSRVENEPTGSRGAFVFKLSVTGAWLHWWQLVVSELAQKDGI